MHDPFMSQPKGEPETVAPTATAERSMSVVRVHAIRYSSIPA